MASKSLPAYLKQVLESHVERSELSDDGELQEIISRLSRLNETVEKLKADIRTKKAAAK